MAGCANIHKPSDQCACPCHSSHYFGNHICWCQFETKVSSDTAQSSKQYTVANYVDVASMEKRIKELEKQMVALTDMYKHISIECANNQNLLIKVHDRIDHITQSLLNFNIEKRELVKAFDTFLNNC